MKELEKRLRNREQVRKHRHLNALEKKGLENYVARLQSTLDSLAQSIDPRRPLSWKDVAISLLFDEQTSTQENHLLRLQLQRHEHLAQMLWNRSLSMSAPQYALSTTKTWRQASLLGTTKEARLRAVDWIMQHMYHNLNSAFQGVPGHNGLTLHMSPLQDNSAQIIVRKERIDPFPMHTIFRFFQQQHSRQLQLEDIGDNIRYVRFNYSITAQNIVIKYFVEAGRILVLSRGIEHDDRCDVGPLKRTWMDWIVLESLGPNSTRVKEVYETTGWYGRNGDYVAMTTTSPWYQQACESLPPTADGDTIFKKYRQIYQEYLDFAYPNVEVVECRNWCRANS
ncbi:hypothetical protein THRCLA_10393 [Thraustotheca clavata]|uniref:Uncharacterized protein n=1 Tax=Thraustotheca clavata TaxID=74557 RepID=A0A1V9YR43_9STRA|nr:hypothetical protein THRCLA_10393 [Thraustotheca clavata]